MARPRARAPMQAGGQHLPRNSVGSPQIIVEAEFSSQTMEDGNFTAITGSGASWQGTGFVIQHYHGGTGCLAEMTFVG